VVNAGQPGQEFEILAAEGDFAEIHARAAEAAAQVFVARQSQTREMVIEGMISIALGENPRSIESKLQGYLHD